MKDLPTTHNIDNNSCGYCMHFLGYKGEYWTKEYVQNQFTELAMDRCMCCNLNSMIKL